MTRPKAYDPQQGYKYQILTRYNPDGNEWEHCDYAKDKAERNYLLNEYYIAYGPGFSFTWLTLPRKYWAIS